MKSFSSTFIFGVVVSIVCGLAFYELKNSEKEEEQKKMSEKAMPFWKEEDVLELKIQNKNQSINIKREHSDWKILSPVVDKVDSSSLNSMLTAMLNEEVTKIEVEGSVDWEKYGLSLNPNSIELIGSSKNIKLLLSDLKTFDGKRYLKYTDKNDLYVASSIWDQWINRNISELRNKKLFTDFEKIKALKITSGRNLSTFEKVKEMSNESSVKNSADNISEKWVFNKNKDFNLDYEKVNGLMSSLQSFRAIEVVSETVSGDKLKEFNLLKPELSLEMTLDDNSILKMYVSRALKIMGEDSVFVYTDKTPFIYKTNKMTAEKWIINPSDYLKKPEPPKELDAEDNSPQNPHSGIEEFNKAQNLDSHNDKEIEK